MSRVICDTGDEFCRAALAIVLRDGVKASPRGKGVLELVTPTVITLTNPRCPTITTLIRRANYRFGMMEAAWICSGSDDVNKVAAFNRRMREFSDDGKTLWGAYGPRVIGQLPHVISSLKRDPDSRQAVLTTWRPQVGPVRGPSFPAGHDRLEYAGVMEDEPGSPVWDGASWRSKDVPCTVAWHFMLRNSRLNLTVFMRSNDAWLGTPYDILSFTTVQRSVAVILGVDVGEYHHVASNLHLYEEHLELADAMISSTDPGMPQPILPDFEFDSIECMTEAFASVLEDGFHTSGDPGVDAYGAVIHRLSGAIAVPTR